jgi:hypothetical protein
MAAGGGDSVSTPTPPPSPASEGEAAVAHHELQAGASGTYQPVPPSPLPAPRNAPNPDYIAPSAPNPQGLQCPDRITLQHLAGANPAPDIAGPHLAYVFSIWPTFARNAQGGYDGSAPAFGYNATNAIPPGGDPAQNAIGQLAAANTVAGHYIAVGTYVIRFGVWQNAQSNPPYGGSCVGAVYQFGLPYIAGNAPPPIPPRAVLNTPPFASGPNLVAAITRSWNIGSLSTLPGPGATARTFVHIPTCVWMASTVPTIALPFHTVTTTTIAGYTLFLVYSVQVTPGPVTWNWGDSTQSTSTAAVESVPATLPAYDPTAQTWTNPCSVSHAYASVADARIITATETFTITITVSWSDGVAVHTASVPCDPVTGGPCALTIGPAQGWQSGPHPVDQIEPVPFIPPSPTP